MNQMMMIIFHFNRNSGFPSLSGTFGIPARLAHNPKMPKEPSSPSRSDTRIERQYVKNETNRLENNNGQRTTRGIANKGFSGMRKVVARFNFSCNLIGNRPQTLTGHTAKRYGTYYHCRSYCSFRFNLRSCRI